MSIVIKAKDESVSWAQIQECLWKAHESNRGQGIVLKTTLLGPEELEARVNGNGARSTTFVAMDGDRVVGTGTISFQKINKWFFKGVAAHQMLMGVIPEYQGHGIYRKIDACRNALIEQEGVGLIYFGTAEGNLGKQKIAIKDGFRYVDFIATETSDHYSVLMAKWIGKCPYSSLYIRFMYLRLKLKTKMLYRPGKVRRFR